MYNALNTATGVLGMAAIVAFIVCIISVVGAAIRKQKAIQSGLTAEKKKPLVQLISLGLLVIAVVGAVVTGNAAKKVFNEEKNSKPQNHIISTDTPIEPTSIAESNESNETSETTSQAKIPAEMLAQFQGTWTRKNSDDTLIIDGSEINEPEHSYKHKDKVEKIYVWKFALDENGKLIVCNQYDQPRYLYKINENGELEISGIDDGEVTKTFIKTSDDKIVPEISLYPAVGMTEKDVIMSLWGYPKKKNKTTTANGVTEQWVYDEGYIYLTNGVVTAIQEI